MNKTIKLIIFAISILISGCEKEDETKSFMDSINSDIYYSTEIIPADYQKIYGKWKLYDVSGGIHGKGYELDFDFMEIKGIGIYGFIRNNNLFEYGKIESETFDKNTQGFLQINIIPELLKEQRPYMPPQVYIELLETDSLNIFSPCCDMYNYHFKRVK